MARTTVKAPSQTVEMAQTAPPPQLPAVQQPPSNPPPMQPAPLIHTPVPPPQFPASVGRAIIAVQRAVGKIEKKGFNNFQKYKYVAWNDICEQLSPLLAANNLILHQSETARVVERSTEGAVLAIEYAFTPVHAETGESYPPIKWTGLARLTDSKGVIDDKAAAKCHTQAEKYCSIKLFKIVTEDEIDSDAQDGRVQRAKQPMAGPDAMARPTKPALSAASADMAGTASAAVPEDSRKSAPTATGKLTIQQIQKLENEARMAADRGSEALAALWKRLKTQQERAVISGLQSELLERRTKADETIVDPGTGEVT